MENQKIILSLLLIIWGVPVLWLFFLKSYPKKARKILDLLYVYPLFMPKRYKKIYWIIFAVTTILASSITVIIAALK